MAASGLDDGHGSSVLRGSRPTSSARLGRRARGQPEPVRVLRRRRRKAAQLARMLVQLERSVAAAAPAARASRVDARDLGSLRQRLAPPPPPGARGSAPTRAGCARPGRPARGRARRTRCARRRSTRLRLPSIPRRSGRAVLVAAVGLPHLADDQLWRDGAVPVVLLEAEHDVERECPAERIGSRAHAERDRAARGQPVVADAEAQVAAVADGLRARAARSPARAASSTGCPGRRAAAGEARRTALR